MLKYKQNLKHKNENVANSSTVILDNYTNKKTYVAHWEFELVVQV